MTGFHKAHELLPTRPLTGLSPWRLRRSQRKLSRPIQQLDLFRREPALETVRLNRSLTRIRGHGAQVPDCGLDLALPFRWQAPHLRKESARSLLLLGGQVLPHLHAIQHSLLLFGRQAAEALQPLLEPLLALRREPPKLRIVLQRLFLLRRRNVFILPQPLAGMMSLQRRTLRRTWHALRTRHILSPWRWLMLRGAVILLRHGRCCAGDCQRQGEDRRPPEHRHGLSL